MSLNTNGTRRDRPFPWPCSNCLTATVVPAVIPYTAKVKHDGVIHELHFPALEVPRCPNCGETVITSAVDERIRDELRSRLRLSKLVLDYQVNHGPEKRDELKCFRGEPSIEKAISRAARGVDDHCKRFRHQCRIKRKAIEQAEKALLAASPTFQQCADFDALLTTVEKSLERVTGVNRLYFYDVALRIGAKLGILPRRVYLHRGAKEGATKLGLNNNGSVIAVEEMPLPLKDLEPYELEDFLCHYKDEFDKTE